MPLERGASLLLTSAGRRTTLLRHFEHAARRRGWGVIVADADPNAPAMRLAGTSLRSPRLENGRYLRTLLRWVDEYRIRMVVPTIDTELALLTSASPSLKRLGCLALVSDERLLRMAGDKWLTVRHFVPRGFLMPESWLPEHLGRRRLPARLFVRPRAGSSSLDSFSVPRRRLAGVLGLIDRPIIQELVKAQEITIDALLGLNGRLVHYVPRLRVKTVGGESVEGVTISDESLRPWLLRLFNELSLLGGRGPMTIQAFLTPQGPMLSEINPRFGGGYPLAAAAGGRYPEWILRMLEGEDIPSRVGDYRKGLWMTRYYVERFFRGD